MVAGAVWLLAVEHWWLDRPLRWIGPVAGRSAYGAFIDQELVLVGFAVALRPAPLPTESKALTVASGGIAGSFELGRLLIARVPGVARIL